MNSKGFGGFQGASLDHTHIAICGGRNLYCAVWGLQSVRADHDGEVVAARYAGCEISATDESRWSTAARLPPENSRTIGALRVRTVLESVSHRPECMDTRPGTSVTPHIAREGIGVAGIETLLRCWLLCHAVSV